MPPQTLASRGRGSKVQVDDQPRGLGVKPNTYFICENSKLNGISTISGTGSCSLEKPAPLESQLYILPKFATYLHTRILPGVSCWCFFC